MATTRYVWDHLSDDHLLAIAEAEPMSIVYTSEPQVFGGVVSQRTQGATHYYHFDGLDSTRAITDATQQLSDSYIHSAFGGSVATSGSTEVPFRYCGRAGYYAESSAQFYLVRARTYASHVAHWLSPNELDSRGITYSYVANNPVSFIDPSGWGSQLFPKPHIYPTPPSLWDPLIGTVCYWLKGFIRENCGSDGSNVIVRSGMGANARHPQNRAEGIPEPFAAQWFNYFAQQLSELKVSCACELAVSGIPNLIDMFGLPDTPAGKPNWPWQHCASNCTMVAVCCNKDSERCAARLSFLKEILDVIGCCLIDRGRGDSCDSAFQAIDFQANAGGRAGGRTCCCAGKGLGGSAFEALKCCVTACALAFPIGTVEGGDDLPFGPLGVPEGPCPGFNDIIGGLRASTGVSR